VNYSSVIELMAAPGYRYYNPACIMIDIRPLLQRISFQYILDPDGVHGLAHWGRVLENGRRIAEEEGGDLTVITLFAIFHDACRHNQARDPGHGSRAAALALDLLSGHPALTSEQLKLLVKACLEHTNGKTRAKHTIQICWDADRLDLARVGIMPQRSMLCTRTAKSEEMINWANQRALEDFEPIIVREQWGPIFNIRS
jgi:uncharacterized protein